MGMVSYVAAKRPPPTCFSQRGTVTLASMIVWYGMVWCGVVWYGMVWYGMVWYGMVWYGMVWYGMVWCGMVWYGMVWYDSSGPAMNKGVPPYPKRRLCRL